MMRDDDHHQKTVNCSWFVGAEMRVVLAQVIMCFGDPRIMDKRRCLQVMRNLLYFLNQGQTFTKSEAAAVLFSAAKLFRFKDIHLRRLIYLIAEELCPIAEEDGMLESALCRDLRSTYFSCSIYFGYVIYPKAKAVRLLSRITNVPSSIKVEEWLKIAIMSSEYDVSSAGLVCALHLLKKDPGIGIKVFEQVGTVAAESIGRQKFHALCLLSRMQQIETTLGIRELARPHIDKVLSYVLKKEDKYISYPLFVCLVIRLITQIIRASGESGELYVDYWNYMNKCLDVSGNIMLYMGNEMVAIEGLYSVMQLRNISGSRVEATIEEVRSRLPDRHIVRSLQKKSDGRSVMSRVKKPLFFNVHRSMLKWSRIQNHLQADDDDEDDDAQLAISKTQDPAPATNSLYRRKKMAFQY